MFFIGVVSTLLIYPPLADAYGRKWVFIIAMAISAVGQLGLLLTNNIYEAYVYMILVGTAFSAKNVVGLNYNMEFSRQKNYSAIVWIFLLSYSFVVWGMTVWY
jgi:MFS family permease